MDGPFRRFVPFGKRQPLSCVNNNVRCEDRTSGTTAVDCSRKVGATTLNPSSREQRKRSF